MRIGYAILPFLPVLLLCREPMAHSGRPADGAASGAVAAVSQGGAYQAPPSAGSRKQASRLLLEFRHRELRSRLDSLWEDTLRVEPKELPRYRRALRTADMVMAEAASRLGELQRSESAAEARKWESLRTRTERTLFGLARYLADAEGYWLPAREYVSPPANGTGKEL